MVNAGAGQVVGGGAGPTEGLLTLLMKLIQPCVQATCKEPLELLDVLSLG